MLTPPPTRLLARPSPRFLARLALGAPLTLAITLVWTAPAAVADGGLGKVKCHQGHGPGCTASATSTGHAPGRTGTGGRRTCRNAAGARVPCTDPDLGTLHADGCYYKPVGDNPQELKVFGPPRGKPGAWYQQTCPTSTNGLELGQLVWLPTATPASPVEVAHRAVSQLDLESPPIATSPPLNAVQLVQVPTWLWIDPAGWRTRRATASVPGLSVTATAAPTTVTWSLGDGTTLTRPGPCTPYPAGTDPTAASPDCGHTYTRTSRDRPGGTFTVTATITWQITWAGGGRTGTLPALHTNATTTVRVVESRAVVVTARY